ncbi:unnamed protein product [Chilo suppressalis]|uniref:Dual serine/threonine and tyrosine protein kinase n=1 Tax=Chilo suppressalis TaxID=168631 RepID=A0ABN8B6V7_CHISP|nr:unnamed protein product [Chilo suppressalis]
MAGGCAWSRRLSNRMRTLRGLVRDTQRALHDVCDILHFDPEISIAVQEISNLASRTTVLVLLGTSIEARTRLLHCLLGRPLLPDRLPRGCRWLRVQHGTSTQVHLTLGNSEFELVEELECNRRPWDTLPVEDLIRQDQTDLATMLEVEINNPFLKDGLHILIPPDIEYDPGTVDLKTLKQIHSELYSKRELILKGFNPVYLFAIDKIGKNVFSDNCGVSNEIVSSRSEEDFWSTFNLYYMTRCANENGGSVDISDRSDSDIVADRDPGKESKREPAVFSSENCLDLHQLKELNPHAQLLFVLFSDSVDSAEGNRRERVRVSVEATESTEDTVYYAEELPESDQGFIQNVLNETEESPQPKTISTDNRRLSEEQIAFMNELLDQWDLMSTSPPKHYTKSQFLIIDDIEILKNTESTLALYISNAIQNANDSRCKRDGDTDRVLKSRTALLSSVVKFATGCLQSYLLDYCIRLSEVHIKLLQHFILASFDMARELQVVPKKIQYVARQEQHLFETINEKFSEGDKKQELLQIMQEVLQEMRSEINCMDWSVDDLPCHQEHKLVISNSVFYSSQPSPSPSPVRLASSGPGGPASGPSGPASGAASDGEEAVSYDSYNFDDYDIIHADESLSVTESCRNRIKEDDSIIISPVESIRVENEGEMSSVWSRSGWVTACHGTSVSFKQASLDVQQTVLSKLSRKISLKLIKFVDCLKDTYFGTLQRCLETLESSCRQELGGRPASEAMRQLLSVARQVDLQPCASFSLLRSLLDSLRRLLYRLRIGGGDGQSACCGLSPAWRRHVALHTANTLSPQRLAKLISMQILERLSMAHERYQSALTSLETVLANRLHHTEDIKLAIRKKYAPSFARLCLESTSICDLLMYGPPELGREIGRGQYGVVYSVRGGWAGRSPAAVKSVLPADERHYHELAMEFFYTRSIPPHPRIVRLYGSVVQRHGAGGAGGAGPGVLLVSERKVRDLHAAVRAGLGFAARMRISCDIVEGIRYLHSFGLVHRDIKMKNVLLDENDRASLSDLGFCAAEALMSGSVVGTPVHMAPELLAGEYDASVDVYAFGILFWYVCAGNIKLPSAFEIFQNKEQLWSKVKRGLRPERLPHFSDECWEVMESCWASEPSQRAHLGDIQPKLEKILEKALRNDYPNNEPCVDNNTGYEVSDDESLDMTGIERNGV